MRKPSLLTTGPMMGLIENGIAGAFEVYRLHEARERGELLAAIAPQVAAICTGSHTGVKTDAALIGRLPHLKIIGNFGVGYDSIDVAAAAARGIIVTNTPDVLTEEVADTALGLLLVTVREFYPAEKWLRDGRWAREGDYALTPGSLRGRKVGIVGLGRIGRAIARRLAAFDLPVAYHGRRPQPDVALRYYADIIAMARDVDTLIATTPGGPATLGLIDAHVLDALGPNGIFINMARGSVVDEDALIAALKANKILRAGLDVYRTEPNINPQFLTLPNVTLFPHLGSASIPTRDRMGQLVVDNLQAFAAGAPPKTPVAETPFRGW
jgi:lactate dehydrogenase-like 2-hydroxyacid dehydrogenase